MKATYEKTLQTVIMPGSTGFGIPLNETIDMFTAIGQSVCAGYNVAYPDE